MSDTIQTAITALEQELEATQQRSALIERALSGLREIYGVPASSNGATKKADRRTDRPTDRPSKARANGKRGAALTPRSLPDGSGAQVLALLKQHGPLKPRELAKHLNIDAWKIRYVMNPLISAKQVAVTGKTNARTFHLPGKTPGKEGP